MGKRFMNNDNSMQNLKMTIHMQLNGRPRSFAVTQHMTLLDVLRDLAGLQGTKRGCDYGECGACTVILNGRAVNSCCVFAVQADGGIVETIEGIGSEGHLHPIQRAFIDAGAIQCGFCTPGMIMTAKALLDRNPHPTRQEIRMALSGNLCRCTGYVKIEEAVELAVKAISRLPEQKASLSETDAVSGEGMSHDAVGKAGVPAGIPAVADGKEGQA